MQAQLGGLTALEQCSMLRALPVALLLLFPPSNPDGAAVSAHAAWIEAPCNPQSLLRDM